MSLTTRTTKKTLMKRSCSRYATCTATYSDLRKARRSLSTTFCKIMPFLLLKVHSCVSTGSTYTTYCSSSELRSHFCAGRKAKQHSLSHRLAHRRINMSLSQKSSIRWSTRSSKFKRSSLSSCLHKFTRSLPKSSALGQSKTPTTPLTRAKAQGGRSRRSCSVTSHKKAKTSIRWCRAYPSQSRRTLQM